MHVPFFLPVFEEFIHAHYSCLKRWSPLVWGVQICLLPHFPTNADQMEIRATDASQEITLTTVCSHARCPPNKHTHTRLCYLLANSTNAYHLQWKRESWHTGSKPADHPAVTLCEEEPLRIMHNVMEVWKPRRHEASPYSVHVWFWSMTCKCVVSQKLTAVFLFYCQISLSGWKDMLKNDLPSGHLWCRWVFHWNGFGEITSLAH